MKNWKTTIAGWAAGILFAIDPIIKAWEAGAFDGKTGRGLAVAIAVVLLGQWAGDKKKPSDQQSIGNGQVPPIKDEK